MILAPLLLQVSAYAAPTLAPAPAPEPVGRYVEARTASVFAGACHYGGERTTSGREALLAWSIESGSFDGVDLAGACVAALVVDEDNLDDAPRERRSVVYVPASATALQRDALAHWVSARSAQVVGEVRAVEVVPLSICVGDESYAANVQGRFDLAGNSLADHACCKMPFQVWYDPFTPLERRLVGCDERFVVHEPVLDRDWSLPGANAAFFGRFGARTSTAGVATAIPVR